MRAVFPLDRLRNILMSSSAVYGVDWTRSDATAHGYRFLVHVRPGSNPNGMKRNPIAEAGESCGRCVIHMDIVL